MIEKDKTPIFIGALICILLIIISSHFRGVYEDSIIFISTLIFIGVVLTANIDEAYKHSEKGMKIFRIGMIGYFVKETAHFLGNPYKDILFVSGKSVFYLSGLILLVSLILSYRTYKLALKDAFSLPEDDFSERLSGYTDIQLFSIIQHIPTHGIRDKFPLVYKELLRRDLCDEQEAETQSIKYLFDDGGDDEGIYFGLSSKFLLKAGSEGQVRYSSLLIRINEIKSIIFSKWSYTRPAYFRIYFRMDGKRKYVSLFTWQYAELWKKAFESVGLKVEERTKGKNKGKEEFSNVTQEF